DVSGSQRPGRGSSSPIRQHPGNKCCVIRGHRSRQRYSCELGRGTAMDFARFPPEVNSGRMYAGPGSGSMLAAAGAWNGLAAELNSTAASYESVVSGLTSESWLGSSSASMAAAAAPYVQWMSATAAQAEQAATQAN